MKRFLCILSIIVCLVASNFQAASAQNQDTWNPNYHSLAWSPDGTKLVFQDSDWFSNEYSQWEGSSIFLADSDGRNVNLVSSGGYNGSNRTPTWSPDGKMIAFERDSTFWSQEKSTFQGIVINLSGSVFQGNYLYATPKYDGGGELIFVSWKVNPPGIVYIMMVDGNWKTYFLNFIDGSSSPITLDKDPYQECSKSFKGNKAACLDSDRENQKLRIISLEDGKELQKFYIGIPGYNLYEGYPQWSRDDSEILLPTWPTCCWGDQPDDKKPLVIVDLQTEKIKTYEVVYDYAKWHPSGKYILLEHYIGARELDYKKHPFSFQYFLMDMDGKLTRFPSFRTD